MRSDRRPITRHAILTRATMTTTIRPIIEGTCYTQETTMTYLSAITAKLQLTLPTRLCVQLGLERGDEVAAMIEHGAITPDADRVIARLIHIHRDHSKDTLIA